MATLSVQTIVETGLNPSFAAAAAGLADQFAGSGKELFYVKNGGGSACVVTIDAPTPCNRGTTHDGGGSVPAAGERVFGPFPINEFNDANGFVQVTYDQVASVTVAVLKLPV